MIDLPHSGRCRHSGCGRRAIRNALCLDHLTELAGTGPLPWPMDLAPVTRREQALIRRIGRA